MRVLFGCLVYGLFAFFVGRGMWSCFDRRTRRDLRLLYYRTVERGSYALWRLTGHRRALSWRNRALGLLHWHRGPA